MNTIVAGQRIVTAAEFAEVAMGFEPAAKAPAPKVFVPGPADLEDFAEFVEEVTDPSGSEVDAENALHYRSLTQNVRVLSRRRARVTFPKAVSA
ncbi:hypothetical protein GTY65_16225 [Streptomyces sp. SID8379]|uniref:hypothetical protein n=1 Tax=unclassified Streptomyces TaxID=2593676 RepID=UPI00131A1FE5|nr:MULTISPECIES: hypothetical protein [unclassified Streptomyces]MYW65592.1 hypothetical protein [Streptomyces sp. SID8379]